MPNSCRCDLRALSLSLLNVIAAVAIVASGSARADAEKTVSYNRDIRPILAENCFACHGADEKANDSGLRLDVREEALDYGAITPGDLDASVLIDTILSDDPDYIMPPPRSHKKLSAEQKQKLKDWVAQGAVYEGHWSFVELNKPEPPEVANKAWPRNAIDKFILARLEAEGMAPAKEADPRVLFRRVHLDTTGLPPKPADVEAFVADYQERGDLALSEWIDRLMATPAWGEHRARYWLDAARYGDTHGLHYDNYREIWPYRDWVIRAFNKNQPFDEFTVEQLAGDLLPNPTDDQLIATGFQRCNMTTHEGGTIDEENRAIYAADRVQTFGWVFLGLTTNCAQCHDHKFDPITMKDYYSLAAFFRNTTEPARDGNRKDGQGPTILAVRMADRPRWEALPGEIAAAEKARQERRVAAKPEFEQWVTSADKKEIIEAMAGTGLVVHAPLDGGSDASTKPGADALAVSGIKESQAKAKGEIQWAEGKLGRAPVLNSKTTLNLGDRGNLDVAKPLAYGAWSKTSSAGATYSVMSKMDVDRQYRGWDIYISGQKFAIHLIDSWTGNAIKVTSRDKVIKPNVWQHLFMTYDGSGNAKGVKLYVDGKSVPTVINTNTLKPGATIHTSAPLYIGQRSRGAVFEGGSVQDVRLYDRLLADGEVARLAEGVALGIALDRPMSEWTDEQQASLLGYYLRQHDEPYLQADAQWASLKSEQEAIRKRSPITHIQKERTDRPAMTHMLMRGQYDMKGDQVAAAPPEALHPMPEGAPANRLGLAQWVVDPANPLTPRVTMNRFWQQVFGRGIVPTAGDLGVSGALPDHPELLDWLAADFRDNGWDVRQAFKQMLMSSTYRQAAIATDEEVEADPPNALLARGPRFRMDAEMVRDLALSTSGLMVEQMYGPGARPYQPSNIWNVVGLPNGDTRKYVQDKGDNLYRRSVYTFWKRMAPPPNLEAFNAPSREFCTVTRERTNTPLQALVLLNDPTFVEAARHLAQNAMKHGGDDRAKVAQFAAERLLARQLTEPELAIVLGSLARYVDHYSPRPKDASALIGVGDSPADASLDPVKLAAWTMVSSELMNLDEAINK